MDICPDHAPLSAEHSYVKATARPRRRWRALKRATKQMQKRERKARAQFIAKSGLIYRGPSLIDGSPIIALAIHTRPKSANDKTGPMVQTYILREDQNPVHANKSGADYAICGKCPHRGTPTKSRQWKLAKDRACYVQIAKGPLNVWKTWARGRYRDSTGPEQIAELGAGRTVRLGAYGDPAAVPVAVWETLLSNCAGWTAYSHQAGIPTAQFSPQIMMRSVDNLDQAKDAWARGERTFRVGAEGDSAVPGFEIDCVNTTHPEVQCFKCKLCDGTRNHPNAKSIFIPAHGAGKKHFNTVITFNSKKG